METITKGNKLFKSGKFLMTAAATVAVVVSATATSLTSINADDSAAPAKVTTSQKAEPRENHTYKGREFNAPIRVETHDIWTANSESVIADNMSKQGIKSVDQLGDYKVVWGDTLSTIAAHFNVSTDELAQRFNIADVNFIAAGITMKDQASINALESQVVHDAQWNGQYNAKVAPSQASDATQSTGASNDTNGQAGATASTPAAQAPTANAEAPAQGTNSSNTPVGGAKTDQTPAATPADNGSKSADTNIGNASDVVKGVDGGVNTPTTQPAPAAPVEAQKPATETPKTDVPAPATNTDKGDDTNIGNASDVIKGVDNGKDTPAAQPAPAAPVDAQKPTTEAPKTEAPAPATNTDKGADGGVTTPATQPAAEAPVDAQKPVTETPKTEAPAPAPATNTDKDNDTNVGNPTDVVKGADDGANTPATQPAAPVTPAPAQNPATETPKAEAPATNTPYTGTPSNTTPVETQGPASEEPTSETVPANPVDGSTFVATDYASHRSFGTMTYHTSLSGISVSDLTNGSYQGLWLDTSGNAINPHNPLLIIYTKAIIDRMVTRYIDAQTPVEGTELERPDQLTGGASNSTNVGSASDVISSIIGG